ncbi:MAG TPA: DUF1844 domain-containing protein [Thermoanaerobaculia bacterium]|nr:DUF1844 domain-containing protein [Thermoanaerobaculia bacterium]HUM30955.1 DUF1844 domain-containing protein [Thermoanaerobaculia bacterium]HXK69385.1 DUF1844 domain-containing protein [Thermoanaerobaculia bacterium]
MKVVDKRVFTQDGELRAEEHPEENENQTAPSEEAIAQEQKDSSEEKPSASFPPKPDFSSFVMGLYTSAAIQMGLMTLPNETIEPDLTMAKQTIDLLELIRDKTHGNLTDTEQKLIDDLLAELQIAFVHKWQKQ